MTSKSSLKRGNVARRITLAQRRVLLQRIRGEVARVVEEIEGMAESLRSIDAVRRELTAADRDVLRLFDIEQRRQEAELRRLCGEYESLALRQRPRVEEQAAAA